MSLTLMAAMSRNHAIGRQGQIPWRLSHDMKRFKERTEGKIVVMGRKTWDSLPKKPLPNRHNWVLSRDENLVLPEGVRRLEYPGQVIEAAKDTDVVVIGGGEIYAIFLPFANILDMTIVETHVEDADAFFPKLKYTDWLIHNATTRLADEKNEFDAHYVVYRHHEYIPASQEEAARLSSL